MPQAKTVVPQAKTVAAPGPKPVGVGPEPAPTHAPGPSAGVQNPRRKSVNEAQLSAKAARTRLEAAVQRKHAADDGVVDARRSVADARKEHRSGASDPELDRREAVDCSPRIRETGTRPCPDCCSPWIVLADLHVDTLGTVVVDQLAHRRFLFAFGRVSFTCDGGGGRDTVRPHGRELTGAEREVLKSSFTTQAADRAEHAAPAGILAAPALTLRGATRTRPLRDLIGDRTVADLAAADITVLTAAAEGSGADPAAVAHVHELARLVTRLLT